MSRAEAIASAVVGFLTPEYTDERTGEHTFSDPVAFEKIRLGYACASCLAEFKTYMAVCPLCGNERDVLADMKETPADIQAYWDEATGPSPGKTVARPMHEVIEEIVAGTADMESIPLKQLRPSRWGAK
jgi:hypothetical protein